MKYVKYALMAVGLLGALLCLKFGVLSAGLHGIIVFVACLVPVGLGALGTFVQPGMRRWAAVTSALCFVLVAMKTSGGIDGGSLEKIMFAAGIGLLLSIALAAKPEAAAAWDRSRLDWER